MHRFADPLDRALLDDWQRNFPISARPFMALAQHLGTSETDVIARLRAKQAAGQITRVGATVAPNTIAASTLAAVAAPEARIEEVAAIIGSEPGVNHSYLRENVWNLWFVATGPDRAHVDAALARIGRRSGLRVLDLPLVRPFNLDLGFSLRGETGARPAPMPPDITVLRPGDRAIVQALMHGLPLVERPYAEIGAALGLDMDMVIARIRALVRARIIARLGVIVRHRALGWRANAMVVWDLPHDAITAAGPALAAQPGVTLCYERSPVEGVWPYRLYSMIHARSRAEALAHLDQATTRPELQGVPHRALFSSHCFKQTGALVARERAMT
ncbi:siroheme decarboxylase subunit beta [Paracoccus salsus]|uniref:siroheme decarboxylase subunit beta n=1 Tax=Paracoccus salsus TaxID=2911061 RepID=UPI001F2F2E67|nr:Lrp/AsnC family transcriptional regulator [Paracoccus salsus]MCF3973539.1 Lrp/AsnC family transcriptional regulator [Paracoccus salsus]